MEASFAGQTKGGIACEDKHSLWRDFMKSVLSCLTVLSQGNDGYPACVLRVFLLSSTLRYTLKVGDAS